ncbi:rubredoxin [Candidatus Saccharibacteria bacterium]|nr:rubredoxin [Candidatus Saccharibacteria bacterium]
MKYRCKVCGYVYDEAEQEVKFADLTADYRCPPCQLGIEVFELVDGGDVASD